MDGAPMKNTGYHTRSLRWKQRREVSEETSDRQAYWVVGNLRGMQSINPVVAIGQ